MADTQKLVTKKFHVDTAGNFVLSVQDNTAAYYVFAGKHTPYTPNDAIIEVPTDSVQSSTFDIYDNMLFGKKVQPQDIRLMIDRHDWETGTQYAMYDHTDGDLFNKNFYTVVDTGAQFHVYKCLDNNNGANSTVEPSGTSLTPIWSDVDGYKWQYMYTVDSSTMSKFQTSNSIPVVVNTAVTTGAIPGTIETIKVVEGGAGYNNYFASSFRLGDIRVNNQEKVYALREEASGDNNYYQGCVIKITSGVASDEYRIIEDYGIIDGKKLIFLNEPFTNTPSPTDTYEIYPFVYVFGDGSQTANCMARAIVNPAAGNSISKVEILDPGSGYRGAVALVDIMEIVGVSANCVLTPIIAPPGGHGSDPAQELGADRVGISIRFANTEGGNIPAVNDYRTVGVVKDPLFQNVRIAIDTNETIGTFFIGETVRQYRDIQLTGAVATTANVATITGTNTKFDSSLKAGDWVHITDGTVNFFSTVLNVVSNTEFNCTSNAPAALAGASISVLDTEPYGEVTALATGEITLTNVTTKNLSQSVLKLFGETSYSSTIIDTGAPKPVSINDKLLNGFYNTYVQLNEFVGELTTPVEFTADETVTEESLVTYTQPNAKFHSFIEGGTSDRMYVSNVRNIFMTDADISGASSNAVFNLSNKYPGFIVPDSGKILYIENVDPISRQTSRSETIKIILEF